jgi:group I intron endonuclease
MMRYLTMRGCGIYAIMNTRTGRMYIGSTASFERRWHQHREALTRGTHHSYKLQSDWRLYGADCFQFTILEHCHPAQRLDREQFYITRYGAAILGYNVNPFTRPVEERMRGRPSGGTRQAIKQLRKKQLG